MSSAWGLFPYPTYALGRFQDGSLVDAPEICTACSIRECAADTGTPAGELAQCRYRVTYARLDDERVLVGVVATDQPVTTRQTQRLGRRYPGMRVRTRDLKAAIGRVRALGPEVLNDFDLAQRKILSDLKTDPSMHEALARKLRRDFEANLDQSHDFLQLVKLVRGHAEAQLLQKHPDLETLEAAECEPHLGAIYFSTELMLVKMDALIFLREINRALGSPSYFQIHPHVLKYVRIYNWQARQKEVTIRVQGTSYAKVALNSAAVGAVIQGLLDNLVKYAPAGSDATINFTESEHSVDLEFLSLGPKIKPDETSRIFLPGFRAEAAKQMESSGLGIGLATAKEICNALELDMRVTQSSEEHQKYVGRYETGFTLSFPL